MEAEQNMTQVITQTAIEATKAVIMAVRRGDNSVNSARPVQAIPKTLKHTPFDWKAEDNSKNIFITNSYNMQEKKKSPNYTHLARQRGTFDLYKH